MRRRYVIGESGEERSLAECLAEERDHPGSYLKPGYTDRLVPPAVADVVPEDAPW